MVGYYSKPLASRYRRRRIGDFQVTVLFRQTFENKIGMVLNVLCDIYASQTPGDRPLGVLFPASMMARPVTLVLTTVVSTVAAQSA